MQTSVELAETCQWRRSLATVAVVLALAACGGGSSGGDAATSNTRNGSGGASSSSSSRVAESSRSTASSSVPADKGDFCRLVTKKEAEAALGKAVQAGVSTAAGTPFGPGGSCIYRATDISATAISLLNVGVLGDHVPRSVFDEQAEAKVGANGQPVAGLGEVAFFLPGPGGGVVFLFDHGVWLQVQVAGATGSAGVDQMAELARKALGRM